MKTKFCADEVMVNLPLFHSGTGGSIPTSALHLHFEEIHRDTFMPLNEAWHSRLPECKNAFEGVFFGGLHDHEYWVVAWWSKPVARAYNGKGYLELRRMAIRDNAPKNTASRFLGWMARHLRKTTPTTKLISYQDAEVHTGTIYRASGWSPEGIKKNIGTGWQTRDANRQNQSTADKIRWEYQLQPEPKNEII